MSDSRLRSTGPSSSSTDSGHQRGNGSARSEPDPEGRGPVPQQANADSRLAAEAPHKPLESRARVRGMMPSRNLGSHRSYSLESRFNDGVDPLRRGPGYHRDFGRHGDHSAYPAPHGYDLMGNAIRDSPPSRAPMQSYQLYPPAHQHHQRHAAARDNGLHYSSVLSSSLYDSHRHGLHDSGIRDDAMRYRRLSYPSRPTRHQHHAAPSAIRLPMRHQPAVPAPAHQTASSQAAAVQTHAPSRGAAGHGPIARWPGDHSVLLETPPASASTAHGSSARGDGSRDGKRRWGSVEDDGDGDGAHATKMRRVAADTERLEQEASAAAPEHAPQMHAHQMHAQEEADIVPITDACSICFERRCEFSFPVCQDQFCRKCIKTYFEGKIKESWGLKKLELNCPVCMDVLSKNVWSRHVCADMLDLYDKYNEGLQVVCRHCADCGERVTLFDKTRMPQLKSTARRGDSEQVSTAVTHCPVPVTATSHAARDSTQQQHTGGITNPSVDVAQSTRTSEESASASGVRIRGPMPPQEKGLALFRQFAEIFVLGTRCANTLLFEFANLNTGNVSPREFYSTFYESAKSHVLENRQCLRSGHVNTTRLDREIGILSLQMVMHIYDKDLNLELQHMHVGRFPQCRCQSCQAELCFQCGLSTWHCGQTCEEHIESVIAELAAKSARCGSLTKLETDQQAALVWKRRKSKRCPKCYLFIQRGDGCNKMECSHCGHIFCWNCLADWSTSCGFYKCSRAPTVDDQNTSGVAAAKSDAAESHSSGKALHTEAGVPDVAQITNRIMRRRLTTL